MIVRDVAMEFRVEQKNPLGEAERVIIAFTATIHDPKGKHNTMAGERLFRRYYVFEAGKFGPDEMKDILRGLLSNFSETVAEMKALTAAPKKLKGRKPCKPKQLTNSQ